MKKTLLAVLMLVSIGTQAQNAVISGYLLPKKNTNNQPRLVNEQFGVDLPVILGSANTFRITIPKVIKGFYELGTAGVIYLEPGYRLKLEAKADTTYTFTGKGSEENMILAKAKWQDCKLLPLSGNEVLFTWKVLNDPIDTFLTDIQRYKAATTKTISSSKNGFFRQLAEGHTNYYALNLLPPFVARYGWDKDRYQEWIKAKNGDQKDPFYVKKLQRANFLLMGKMLRMFERNRIDSLYALNFDWNNQALFDSSTEYQKALLGQIELSARKIGGQPDAIKLGVINEAKKRITVPKMRAFAVSRSAIDFMKLSKDYSKIDSVYKAAISEPLSTSDRKKLDEAHINAGKATK